MGVEVIVSIAVYSFVLAISPGPNNTALLGIGARFGFRKTLPYLGGMVVGLVVLVGLVAAGVGALIEVYPLAFQVLKYVAFGYVLFLAWRTLQVGKRSGLTVESDAPISWMQAAGFQLVNPKAWIVIATLLAGFVPPDGGWQALVVAALTFIVATMPGATVWAVAGQAVSFLLSGSRAHRILSWVLALALVASMVPVLFSSL